MLFDVGLDWHLASYKYPQEKGLIYVSPLMKVFPSDDQVGSRWRPRYGLTAHGARIVAAPTCSVACPIRP